MDFRHLSKLPVIFEWNITSLQIMKKLKKKNVYIHKVFQAIRITNLFVQKYFNDMASDFLKVRLNQKADWRAVDSPEKEWTNLTRLS